MRDHPIIFFLAILCIVAILSFVGILLRGVFNHVDYEMKKIDETTKYENIKKVEDTCRAMMASYKADVLTWEQYKNSEDSEQRIWAEQARMRANKTAASYNEYVLKNSFLWEENVPKDIQIGLPYIQ